MLNKRFLLANTRTTSLLMLSVFAMLISVQTLSLAHDIIHSDHLHNDDVHNEHQSDHEETEFCQILDTVGASKVLIDSTVELNLVWQRQISVENFTAPLVTVRVIFKNQARAPPLPLSTA